MTIYLCDRFGFVGVLLMLHKYLGFRMELLKKTFSLVYQWTDRGTMKLSGFVVWRKIWS